MKYIDGFVVPVPKKKLKEYQRVAARCGKIWIELGALEFVECAADDLNWGKRTSFPRSVKLKPGETVVFSYIAYKSRAHRDKVMARVIKDPRMAPFMNPKTMPFDTKRMIMGGFRAIVDRRTD